MIQLSRETVAYLLIGMLVAVALPAGIATLRRRRRTKLRRRGIKLHGH